MNAYQKAGYIALGSACTLAGILFATMSPLSAKSGEDVVYENIFCKSLNIVDSDAPRLVMKVVNGEIVVFMTDTSGESVLQIGTQKNKPIISVGNPTTTASIIMDSVFALYKNQDAMASLDSMTGEGNLTLWDSKGAIINK